MNYKGIELVEVTEPQIFDPPKKMLVWEGYSANAVIREVWAIGPKPVTFNICALPIDSDSTIIWEYCAEIPPRRATWKELAYWLIDGKGLVLDENRGKVDTGVIFGKEDLNIEVSDYIKVIKRGDTDWHEPDAQYMGLEEKQNEKEQNG